MSKVFKLVSPHEIAAFSSSNYLMNTATIWCWIKGYITQWFSTRNDLALICFPSWRYRTCLKTFFVIITLGEALLGSSGQRLGMLLNNPWYTGQPLQQRLTQPKRSIVQNWETLDLNWLVLPRHSHGNQLFTDWAKLKCPCEFLLSLFPSRTLMNSLVTGISK